MQGGASHSCSLQSSLISVPSIVAARGIWTSAVATGVCGFLTMILFLFCTPADTTFILSAPQPFVLVYAQALGSGGATFMTILATLGLILVSQLWSISRQDLISPSRTLASPLSLPRVSSSRSLEMGSSLSPVGSVKSRRTVNHETPSGSCWSSGRCSSVSSFRATSLSPRSSLPQAHRPSPLMDSSDSSALL